jgi:RNA polymerase sigma-70 factor (ECF subfamily)
MGQPLQFDGKSHPTDSTSLSLLHRVKQNEESAWRRLMALYAPLVIAWCRRAGLSGEDASDVMQEVFVAVVKDIGDFRRDRPSDTFRGWLRIVTRNRIRMHLRKCNSQPGAMGGSTAHLRIQEIADNALDEPESESGSEQSGLYQRALELLRGEFEQKTWEAFVQTTIQGRKSTDVAADLGMTAGAVRQAKYKVLQRLRNELDELAE